MPELMEQGAAYLSHFGVLGMHWGKHLAGRNEPSHNDVNRAHPEYTSNQRARDKQVYGAAGVQRINAKLNAGQSISVARGEEVTRRNTVLGRNKYLRQTGKVAGSLAAPVLANVAITVLRTHAARKIGAIFIAKTLGKTATGKAVFDTIDGIGAIANTSYGRIAITAGAAYMGNLLGGDIAVAVNTRAGGYDPKRK